MNLNPMSIPLINSPSQSIYQRRIAIISDTHGYVDENVLKAIQGCDRIIHAGDICGAHVLSQLECICPNITAVTGNNDNVDLWPDSEASVVNNLPAIAELELPGGTLAVEHGHKHGMHQPDHESLRASHPQAKVIVYGHTHTMLIDDSKTPWVINPGAAGKTRTGGGASCIMLNAVTDGNWDIEMLRFEDNKGSIA